MKVIFRWLGNKISQSQANILTSEDYPQVAQNVGIGNIRSSGLQFTLYTASGGTVVETNEYDRKTDRHHQNLYVIPSEKDLGTELTHILTMEALKK
jgi:hypothetical protein